MRRNSSDFVTPSFLASAEKAAKSSGLMEKLILTALSSDSESLGRPLAFGLDMANVI